MDGRDKVKKKKNKVRQRLLKIRTKNVIIAAGSIERPLVFYGIPSSIFFIIGLTFTFFAAQYYAEIGRLNTNLTLIAGGTLLIGVILIVTAILLYSLVSVVREGKSR